MSEFTFKRLFGPAPRYPLAQAYKPPTNNFVVISGPCSVESEEQINKVARHVAPYATHLRGGVFRAGTYPGDNFGLRVDLLPYYKQAASIFGMQNIIEVLDYRDLAVLNNYASCYQIGCRQMQNYTLLKLLGESGKPVFLKRNPGATLDEWLGSAEYLLKYGCKELYLIERGSVSHLNHVRWDLSISLIPAVKSICNIPVIVDASHGTGRSDLVTPMTLAGVAAGAAGVLVETHPNPYESISDSDQALTFAQYTNLMNKIIKLREVIY